ncbi:hypothetical protein K8R04_03310 [Candidatus Uhrbacteria bacterium]|nr:hypothetical protein [Candidatus Uhrbacteria bacterium]
MTRNLFLFSVALLALPGCMLDRSGLSCPPGTMYQIGGACVPAADADMVDGGLPPNDAGDAMIMADTGLSDGDAGPVDSGPDSGPIDSGPDPIDAGTDSGPVDGGPLPDGGPPRRCEDTTTGICIRLDGVPLVADWAAQFHWTRPGGSLHTIDWADRIDCIGGIRVIDADSTECEIAIPDPGTPVIDTGLAYVYPEHADGTSPCIMSSCPAYHAGWRLWVRGTEYSTDPAFPGGRCGLENRPGLDGTHAAMRINLP